MQRICWPIEAKTQIKSWKWLMRPAWRWRYRRKQLGALSFGVKSTNYSIFNNFSGLNGLKAFIKSDQMIIPLYDTSEHPQAYGLHDILRDIWQCSRLDPNIGAYFGLDDVPIRQISRKKLKIMIQDSLDELNMKYLAKELEIFVDDMFFTIHGTNDVHNIILDDSFFEMIEELVTLEQCLAAVQEDGWKIEHVPDKFLTEDLCLLAVQQNGWALQFVPEKYKTLDICRAAFQEEAGAIEYIPKKFQKMFESYAQKNTRLKKCQYF
jgi:hypothetical protein